MLPGLENNLVFGGSGAFGGALSGQRGEEGVSGASGSDNGAARGVTEVARVALDPFAEEADTGKEEGPFFVSGLNGLLAPPSIATVQEEQETRGPGEPDESETAGEAAAESASVAGESDEETEEAASDGSSEEEGPDGLTEEERSQVDDLKERDAEVRRHEQAHKSVGGQYAGAISLTYENGPDGNRYAVGGEVPIDASPIPGDPGATIRKLETVRRAALAPAEPSAADHAVAAKAGQGIQQARAEQIEQRAEELEEQNSPDEEGPETAEQGNAPTPGSANAQIDPFVDASGDAQAVSPANDFSGTPSDGIREGSAFDIASVAARGTEEGDKTRIGVSYDRSGRETDSGFTAGPTRKSPFDISDTGAYLGGYVSLNIAV